MGATLDHVAVLSQVVIVGKIRQQAPVGNIKPKKNGTNPQIT
jgi:hypothetical protein